MAEKYSVLMSIYYKENPVYFRQALDSMLAQTVSPDEIVLVCDGPLTEPLDDIIQDYQSQFPELFTIIRLPENAGLGIALNQGLSKCRNELVARMDTDDIAVPDRMAKQLSVLGRIPELSAIGGQIEEFDEHSGRVTGYRNVPTQPNEIRRLVGFKNPMNHMTITFRKSSVIDAGGYQSLIGFEDYYLWSRMLAKGQMLQNLEDVCCHVRVDQNLYGRRGGMAYFKNTVVMEKKLLSMKFINKFQYLSNVTIRFFGSVVLSAKLRGMLYRTALRDNFVKK